LNFAETPAQSIAYENQVFKPGLNGASQEGNSTHDDVAYRSRRAQPR
jgi:hypothetical protein